MEIPKKKESKNSVTILSYSLTAGYTSAENYRLKGYMHLNVHGSTVYNSKAWKQPECPSTEDWIKMWYTHGMEYCCCCLVTNSCLTLL